MKEERKDIFWGVLLASAAWAVIKASGAFVAGKLATWELRRELEKEC